MFGRKTEELSSKVSDLIEMNNDLKKKTNELNSENAKMNSLIGSFIGSGLEEFTGESTYNELGIPNEIIINYESLRVRSWEFILKNHIAELMINKRVNWLIGSGLLFNAKPLDQPFKDYYGTGWEEKKAEFISKIEYQYRNYAKSELVDHGKEKNLHELAREIDYNASGDGDVLLIARVRNGLPTVQAISGQCVVNPSVIEDIDRGNTICEGVEKNKDGEVVAYHVQVDTDMSNGVYTPNPSNDIKNGTKRVPVYFEGDKNIKQAWLYRQSDLQKLGETRSMPLLSHIFEALKHLNDYLIANAKNAQLLAQMVLFLEKDQNSDGNRIFGGNTVNVAGMGDSVSNDNIATDSEVALSANKIERKLNGNGIVGDLPKGVKAKILNPTSQSDQTEYLKSTLQTVFASIGQPYEVAISSYNSNYTASMGSRGDFQHSIDVSTEVIPSSQLYKMNYKLFLYLQVLSGKIDFPPLLSAYKNNDIISIESISNCKFEGTKLKPIDPLKFIKSLKEQLPEKIRQHMPLNTCENIVNMASGGDFEGVINQMASEINDFESKNIILEDNGAVQV